MAAQMLSEEAHSVVIGRNLIGNKNLKSLLIAVEGYREMAGIVSACELVHFFAQLAHESAGFRYDREIWGPTAAQRRYDTRTDLGNTPEADGDGKLYMGRGPIQVTGKANYREFRDWCTARGLNPPDFVASPESLCADPWEGLSALWYWSTRKLSRAAQGGSVAAVTKIINGGYNGLKDRERLFVRYGSYALYGDILEPRDLQKRLGVAVDGIVGDGTRRALSNKLKEIKL